MKIIRPGRLMAGVLAVGTGIGFLIASVIVDDDLKLEFEIGGKVGSQASIDYWNLTKKKNDDLDLRIITITNGLANSLMVSGGVVLAMSLLKVFQHRQWFFESTSEPRSRGDSGAVVDE